MNQEPQEEEWITIQAASKRFNVSTPTLYDLAYEGDPPRVKSRTIIRGRVQSKLELLLSDLKKWDDGRTSHWKEKAKKPSEQPSRTEPAFAH